LEDYVLNGIINIRKEKGYTSHDVVAVVRRILKQKKVGHTGTLDPDAEGVLPICVGKATKLADYIMNSGKTYQAEITFGAETTTQDSSGDITKCYNIDFDEEKIRKAVESFKGEYMQIPPMYSAIKVNGKKLYELARKGQTVERKARKVKIYDIKIDKFLPPDKIVITVDCSKGTYIRTLSEDIGKKLDFGGYMSYLCRTRSSAFKIENSITLSELEKLCEDGKISQAVMKMEDALFEYKKVHAENKADKLMHNGGKIYDYFLDENITVGETVIAFDSKNQLNGIYIVENDKEKDRKYIKPVTILL
jgi:tRNA pseudouridine55 synthase